MPPGDADLAAAINIEDLNLVRNHFGTINPFPGQGETNVDGLVNITDLNNVRNNFSFVNPGSAPAPERAA